MQVAAQRRATGSGHAPPSCVRIVAEALLTAEAEAPYTDVRMRTIAQLRRAVAKELNVKEKELRGTAIKEVLHQVVASN